MKFRWKNLLFWFALVFFLFEPLQDTVFNGKPFKIREISNHFAVLLASSSFIVFSLYTIGTYLAFFKFYANRKWAYLIPSMLAVLIIPIILRYGIEEVFYDRVFGFSNYNDEMPFENYFRDNLFYGFRFGLIGFIYYFIQQTFYRQKAQAKLELENKQVQLQSLRSQLNPHFLLNSLNNIYSLVYHKSDKALPALENLSEILKYGLYEEQTMVKLDKELDFVNEYISLHQYRVANDINFKIEVSEEAKNAEIPHFLLIPLVENIFNHGDMKQPVEFVATSNADQLQMQFRNSIAQNRMKEKGGIGLENTKKRLQLLYADKASIKTEKVANQFVVSLNLPNS